MYNLISISLLFILKYLLLFSFGTVSGWIIEFFWRRFFEDEKRWVNPGFLNGPWLPVYGFGVILLFWLSSLNLPIYMIAVMFLLGLTLIEYIAGLIFIKKYKIKLWDYSKNRGNYKGIICPLYSFFWMSLGLLFYTVIYPFLNRTIDKLYLNTHFSFFIGIYIGLITIDIWQSFGIAYRIRTFIDETEYKKLINFETFKLELRDRVQINFKNRTRFFLPFKGELGNTFTDRLRTHTLNLSKNLKPISKVIKNRIKTKSDK